MLRFIFLLSQRLSSQILNAPTASTTADATETMAAATICQPFTPPRKPPSPRRMCRRPAAVLVPSILPPSLHCHRRGHYKRTQDGLADSLDLRPEEQGQWRPKTTTQNTQQLIGMQAGSLQRRRMKITQQSADGDG